MHEALGHRLAMPAETVLYTTMDSFFTRVLINIQLKEHCNLFLFNSQQQSLTNADCHASQPVLLNPDLVWQPSGVTAWLTPFEYLPLQHCPVLSVVQCLEALLRTP